MDATLTTPPPSAPPPMPGGGSGKKWVLFGCGGCLVLIILAGLVGGGIALLVFGALKDSDVYQTALKAAQDSPQVQAALGTPIKPGMMVGGNLATNNGQGTADLTFSISGPNGSGTVSAKASKPPGGAWDYSVLQVIVVGTGEVIDLRGSP